ncbi:uncharacterized protein LY89DRAFT_72407 [Mollisia scopiformis]|uniref:STAS domain-containing protein n=1 Tax=Mollisia scopiformis TaxID=149040 RepID=A0A194XBI1_MOLSC|nr:uncharacterized protein LY89DRAFT_72407 [Mollisia scopiformis]KUJ17117.1 hypothetical protein LY89DRAFT_72407 [Mollisia scopiformis]
MGLGTKIADKFRKDANWVRLGRGVVLGARGIRAGTGRYLSNKVPIVQWIPAYVPKWLISDLIAGQSAGLLLIPQAMMYSVLAGVSIQQALLASWLPGIIYTFMGTSRDLSVGPTSTTAILTGQVLLGFKEFKVPPVLVAAALSFCIGIWSLIFGIFNLGFIFDFVSIPMAIGFTMGISFVAITLQIPTILGLMGIPPSFMAVMPAILKSLSNIKPITVGIGGTSILILAFLQFVGGKWGHKSEVLRIVCNSRTIFVLLIYTLISFLLNKNLQEPLWAILGPIKTNITTATVPNLQLVQNLFLSSAILFGSISIEHVALAKAFGNEHEYSINQSQELFSLGITNLVNSFFGALPVGGGDIARTSVLAASGVRSPLAGLFTSATVLVSMYALSPFLQYLPQATVSAVIIVAIISKMPPQAIINKYWKLSFVDFVHFILAFNITMLATALIGIGLSLGFMIAYTLLRTMFSRPSEVKASDLETSYSAVTPPWWAHNERIPAGTQVVRLETDCMFLNADRIKRHVIDTVLTYQAGIPSSRAKPEDRPWNLRMDKHIRDLRKRAGVNNADTFIPRLRIVVLYLSSTSFIDSSGIAALQAIKKTLLAYGGESVEFRFVGLCPDVKRRFERAEWTLVNPYEEIARIEILGEEEKDKVEEKKDLLFEHLPHAIGYQGAAGREHATFEFEAVEMYSKRA